MAKISPKFITIYGSFEKRGWGNGTLVRKTGELIAFASEFSSSVNPPVEVINKTLWKEYNGKI